jgi:hypothetical protein
MLNWLTRAFSPAPYAADFYLISGASVSPCVAGRSDYSIDAMMAHSWCWISNMRKKMAAGSYGSTIKSPLAPFCPWPNP